MFQYVKEHANSLLESWAFKKANWTNSRKWYDLANGPKNA
jgi:hypothetical protein